MVLITIVNGVYKPTYNWGAHIVGIFSRISMERVWDFLVISIKKNLWDSSVILMCFQ